MPSAGDFSIEWMQPFSEPVRFQYLSAAWWQYFIGPANTAVAPIIRINAGETPDTIALAFSVIGRAIEANVVISEIVADLGIATITEVPSLGVEIMVEGFELREDMDQELREDGSIELREAALEVSGLSENFADAGIIEIPPELANVSITEVDF